MTDDDIHVRVQASKVAAWFLIAVTAIAGAAFTWGGIDALIGRASADSALLLVLGLAFLLLTERLARYFLRPQMTVSPRDLTIRPFWGRTIKWDYADTTRWTTSTQRIEKSWNGRRLRVPITVERLHRYDATGDRHSAVLPGFAGQNHQMLRAVEMRSGVAITPESA